MFSGRGGTKSKCDRIFCPMWCSSALTFGVIGVVPTTSIVSEIFLGTLLGDSALTSPAADNNGVVGVSGVPTAAIPPKSGIYEQKQTCCWLCTDSRRPFYSSLLRKHRQLTFPGASVSKRCRRVWSSYSQFASASFNSYNRTMSCLNSLKWVTMSSVGMGFSSGNKRMDMVQFHRRNLRELTNATASVCQAT